MPEPTSPYSPAMLRELPLRSIAAIIQLDWPNMYFGAVPYADAMFSLTSITDNYGYDTGDSVVAYFLANANTWRGQTARAVKAELKRRLAAA